MPTTREPAGSSAAPPERHPVQRHRRLSLDDSGEALVDGPVGAGRVDALVVGHHRPHHLQRGHRLRTIDIPLGGVGRRVPKLAPVAPHDGQEVRGDPVAGAGALERHAEHAVLGQRLGHLTQLVPGLRRAVHQIGAVPEGLAVDAPGQPIDRGIGEGGKVAGRQLGVIGGVLGEAIGQLGEEIVEFDRRVGAAEVVGGIKALQRAERDEAPDPLAVIVIDVVLNALAGDELLDLLLQELVLRGLDVDRDAGFRSDFSVNAVSAGTCGQAGARTLMVEFCATV